MCSLLRSLSLPLYTDNNLTTHHTLDIELYKTNKFPNCSTLFILSRNLSSIFISYISIHTEFGFNWLINFMIYTGCRCYPYMLLNSALCWIFAFNLIFIYLFSKWMILAVCNRRIFVLDKVIRVRNV